MSEASDLEAVKQIQRAMWSEGDFSMIATAGTRARALVAPAEYLEAVATRA